MTFASLALAIALAVSVTVFLAQRLFARFVAVPEAIAPARGSAAAGVLYAFTRAFAPTAKESAALHLPSYIAGVGYHLGIFAALLRLLTSLLPVALPAAANIILAVVLALGLVCGLALLGKRTLDDDFLGNILVDVTLAVGLAASLNHELMPWFQFTGAVLLLYAPLGKLRHVVFLLASRRWSGAYFGRRGVRPNPQAPGTGRG
jgi:hypothetical protein